MPELTFRPLQKADFATVAAWIGRPHVQKWWHEPATVEHVASEYGACTDGDFRTRVYIVQAGGRDIGMIQCYRTDDWADDTAEWGASGFVGIDYLIGEAGATGRGYGSAMIAQFITAVVKPLYPDAKGAVADPETANLASIGALKRAGFTSGKIIPKGEYGTPEQLMVYSYGMSNTKHMMQSNGASGAVYGLGFIGAIVYYLQHSATLWMGLLGVLKAIVWPAILVYQALQYFHL